MEKLIHIIYVSASKEIFGEYELIRLLESIRTRNKKHNITGMLLYNDGNIMQLIEGAEADVSQLFENIKSDERHTGIIEMVRDEISERTFTEWSMSYKNITDIYVEGFSDFLSFGSFPNERSSVISRAKKLLLSFRG
ncbi:BLUF domain-containing protein [Oceanicoccus sp. KOV_DT_Chl]|uniref:BLUF domain-containing protein n=1 Tax=Oceanicoccus sp. KOV_DT_Chl TaxID=1904639 RepID=UPI000C7E1BD2|nr:BLUF domain-containing protein [Oceanicoccus sp. KOV_DT_Chl]